jgi:hypothetical protein
VWIDVFDNQQPPLFTTPICENKTTWTVWLDPKALWDRLRTLSHVAMLQGEEKDVFKGKFDRILRERDEHTSATGVMEASGSTMFAWTRKL